jgi:hypothetical protein
MRISLGACGEARVVYDTVAPESGFGSNSRLLHAAAAFTPA